jgi:hypothetical protein
VGSALGGALCELRVRGRRLGSAADAAAVAAFDIATFGAIEAIDAAAHQHPVSSNHTPGRVYFRRLLVTYGDDDLARGFFEPYALVPENGVSGPMPWTHP